MKHKPRKYPGSAQTTFCRPVARSIAANSPAPEFRTHKRPSYQRGECGMESPRLMISSVVMSITMPPVALFSRQARHVGGSQGRHILGTVFDKRQSVKMAAILRHQVGDEIGLPKGNKIVIETQSRKAGKSRGRYNYPFARDGHVMGMQIAGVIGRHGANTRRRNDRVDFPKNRGPKAAYWQKCTSRGAWPRPCGYPTAARPRGLSKSRIKSVSWRPSQPIIATLPA